MTLRERLVKIRDQIAANLDAETAAQLDGTANPKPSYSIDGESVDWTNWQKAQREEIAELEKIIVKLSPYIITTRQTL